MVCESSLWQVVIMVAVGDRFQTLENNFHPGIQTRLAFMAP